jgi:hypothetical protein
MKFLVSQILNLRHSMIKFQVQKMLLVIKPNSNEIPSLKH